MRARTQWQTGRQTDRHICRDGCMWAGTHVRVLLQLCLPLHVCWMGYGCPPVHLHVPLHCHSHVIMIIDLFYFEADHTKSLLYR
ncbi:hypothetical protein KP509_17G032600 [Ceratopteris richardii]|uniref:Uncharacterized protein n=1 Tax=Ceratopteris richardii TaxID=49495 RepID=A0A8T2SU19_CERRI|nr:hypothetical protein KP509_17G032600 [Ceratopteris richardii]